MTKKDVLNKCIKIVKFKDVFDVIKKIEKYNKYDIVNVYENYLCFSKQTQQFYTMGIFDITLSIPHKIYKDVWYKIYTNNSHIGILVCLQIKKNIYFTNKHICDCLDDIKYIDKNLYKLAEITNSFDTFYSHSIGLCKLKKFLENGNIFKIYNKIDENEYHMFKKLFLNNINNVSNFNININGIIISKLNDVYKTSIYDLYLKNDNMEHLVKPIYLAVKARRMKINNFLKKVQIEILKSSII